MIIIVVPILAIAILLGFLLPGNSAKGHAVSIDIPIRIFNVSYGLFNDTNGTSLSYLDDLNSLSRQVILIVFCMMNAAHCYF